MKETIAIVVLVVFVIGGILGTGVYSMRMQHQCTIAGMIAGYDASEIRAICK